MINLKRKIICGLLVSLTLLSGCGKNNHEHKDNHNHNHNHVGEHEKADKNVIKANEVLEKYDITITGAFDTVTKAAIYAKSEDEAQKYLSYIEHRLQDLHEKFNSFEAYDNLNNVKTINDMAGKEAVPVCDEILNLLEFAKEYENKYSNKTNILIGSITDLWLKYRTAYTFEESLEMPSDEEMQARKADVIKEFGSALPTDKELKAAKAFCDPQNLEIDKNNKTVFLKKPKMMLDVGSIAKGYACQIIKEEVEKMGVEAGLISAGGNVVTLGDVNKLGRDKFIIGVQSPDGKNFQKYQDGIILKLGIKDEAVVTSGDYQRYFDLDGKRYCHIIDPDSAMPGNLYRSVTVVTKDSGLADFLSTALFLTPLDEAMKLVNSQEGIEAVFVTDDGQFHFSKNMKNYLIED